VQMVVLANYILIDSDTPRGRGEFYQNDDFRPRMPCRRSWFERFDRDKMSLVINYPSIAELPVQRCGRAGEGGRVEHVVFPRHSEGRSRW